MSDSHTSPQRHAKAAIQREQDDACISSVEREQARRSANMAAIHGKDTKPEMVVRRWLWGHGFRYRLNHPRLPGKPDIVMRKYRTCIFVNGCFWHGHEGCQYYTIPKTNTEFWVNKIKRNKERDSKMQRALASMGWHSITIWECELRTKVREKTLESLAYTLNRIFLQDHSIGRYEMPEEMPMMAAEDRHDAYDKKGTKHIEVVAAIICKGDRILATQRGYGDFKDWWEFPGGKTESGETPEEALRREIREELSTEISVNEFLCTIEYDYPKFHLTMHCYLCSSLTEALHLNEHEAAKWLPKDELGSVRWLPADLEVVEILRTVVKGQ